MKKIVLTSLLSAFAMAANAAPLVSIGDQTDIFFRGAVLGNYNSNVTYANTNKIDDYAGTLRLGLEANYGKTSKFKANFTYYEDFTKYVDNHEFNCNLAHIAANASYVESNWSVGAHFTFDQNRQNDADTTVANNEGWLVRNNYWTAGAKAQYDFSEKVYGTVAFNWTETEYTGQWKDIYHSHNTYSVPVSVLYRVTQKIAVGLSYQYRNTEYFDGRGDAPARDDHFIGATVTGEIAPKMTCEFYLGAQNYKVDGGEDTWTMATNLKLGYEVSEKCGVYVLAARDFGSSATGSTTTYTYGEGGVNYFFNPKVVGTASLRYTTTDYEMYNRTDDTIWTRVGISYLPNKFVTLGINYNYLNNSSDINTGNYNQHLISFNASLRY